VPDTMLKKYVSIFIVIPKVLLVGIILFIIHKNSMRKAYYFPFLDEVDTEKAK
jgi:hypothetical protein